MNESFIADAIARPCVRSGFCCKQAPCRFGTAGPDGKRCVHLERDLGSALGRYRCGIYDQIVGQPFAELSPAFGGGCSSPLFNDERDRILARRLPVLP
jgi:hypothetical protein